MFQCVEGHLHVGVPLCASVAAERTFCDESLDDTERYAVWCKVLVVQHEELIQSKAARS